MKKACVGFGRPVVALNTMVPFQCGTPSPGNDWVIASCGQMRLGKAAPGLLTALCPIRAFTPPKGPYGSSNISNFRYVHAPSRDFHATVGDRKERNRDSNPLIRSSRATYDDEILASGGGRARMSTFTNVRESVHGAFRRFGKILLIAEPVEHFLSTTKLVEDRDLQRLIGKATAALVWGLLGTSALGTLGVDTKPLVAGIGVSGFLVGFTLKEVATNVLSGVLLVLQRPFKTGSTIKVAGHTGVVRSIDSRYVRLETESKEIVLVPSYMVYSSTIIVVNPGPPSANAAGVVEKVGAAQTKGADGTEAGCSSAVKP